MNFAAVFHKAQAPFSYALDKDTLYLRLQTDLEVERVFLHWGDPFDAGIMGGAEQWTGDRMEIQNPHRVEYSLWWEIEIQPPYKRCRYYFELHQQGEVWFFGEDGFCTQKQQEQGKPSAFYQPWMNPVDIPTPPQWLKQTVWYQIVPDRFARSEHQPKKEGESEWRNGAVTNSQRFGGSLKGITEKLDYLAQLGINGIYPNPIFEAQSVHKYDTTDYTRIDPDFGTEQDFVELVQQAHKRNIKVMIDAVFNHCGERFAPWVDVVEKGKDSPYWDWFMVNEWLPQKQGDTRDKRYYSFAFASNMPKLNTCNPKVADYFSNLCVEWVTKYQIDGIRFDVGNEVSHAFLKQVRRAVCKVRKDVYFLGEIWHDSSEWLNGDEYDAVMNYPFKTAVDSFFEDKTMTSEQFSWEMRRCLGMYRKQTTQAMFQLLDSHDTARLISGCANQAEFLQKLTLLFTMPGSPCIYYGTEIALEGGHDPDCRRCMPWKEIKQEKYQECLQAVKQLIALRKNLPQLQTTQVDFASNNTRNICYLRQGIQVCINADSKEWKLNAGEVLFSQGLKNGILQPNGICIQRVSDNVG